MAKKQLPKTEYELKQLVRRVTATTHDLDLAITMRTLRLVFDFSAEDFNLFAESYKALMDEVADGRSTVPQEIRATKELIGISPKDLLACERIVEKDGTGNG